MAPHPDALDADWLSACRRMAAGVRDVLAARGSTAERAVEVGRGEGGDRTLVIDAEAEAAVFEVLEEMRTGVRCSPRSPRSAAWSTSATRRCGS